MLAGARRLASQCRSFSSKAVTCTLFAGDGIGPEIAASVKAVFKARACAWRLTLALTLRDSACDGGPIHQRTGCGGLH